MPSAVAVRRRLARPRLQRPVGMPLEFVTDPSVVAAPARELAPVGSTVVCDETAYVVLEVRWVQREPLYAVQRVSRPAEVTGAFDALVFARRCQPVGRATAA